MAEGNDTDDVKLSGDVAITGVVKLSGLQKTAILFLALDKDHSKKLLDQMEEMEIRDLTQAMTTLGSVEAVTVEAVLIEFAEQLSGTSGLIGGTSSTERFLLGAFSEAQVDELMADLSGPAGRTMWDKLANVNEEVLANYLKNEYPQTVAVVLSKIRPEHTSRVLSVLPDDFAMDVIVRMLRMETVGRETVNHLERTLRSEFMTEVSHAAQGDSLEKMAEIFNSLDRTTESRFMESLEERDKESADRIQQLMFTFDDMSKVDPAGIQVVMRQVEGDKLALALKGASDELKELFFSNMSERAGKMMQEDMEAMGAVRMKDVEEAQNGIVLAAKALADAGEIVLAGGEDDELVY